MEKEAFEPTGLIPRSIIRTVDRFVQQLLPGREKIALQEYRVSRYQILVSIKSLATLVCLPLLLNFTIKALLFTPAVEHFWNSHQAEIFLNSYQEKRAFAEMHDFSEKMFFESLLIEGKSKAFPFPSPPAIDSMRTKGGLQSVALDVSKSTCPPCPCPEGMGMGMGMDTGVVRMRKAPQTNLLAYKCKAKLCKEICSQSFPLAYKSEICNYLPVGHVTNLLAYKCKAELCKEICSPCFALVDKKLCTQAQEGDGMGKGYKSSCNALAQRSWASSAKLREQISLQSSALHLYASRFVRTCPPGKGKGMQVGLYEDAHASEDAQPSVLHKFTVTRTNLFVKRMPSLALAYKSSCVQSSALEAPFLQKKAWASSAKLREQISDLYASRFVRTPCPSLCKGKCKSKGKEIQSEQGQWLHVMPTPKMWAKAKQSESPTPSVWASRAYQRRMDGHGRYGSIPSGLGLRSASCSYGAKKVSSCPWPLPCPCKAIGIGKSEQIKDLYASATSLPPFLRLHVRFAQEASEGLRASDEGSVLFLESESDRYQSLFQIKSLELAKSYNKQSIVAITNLLGDFLSFFTVSALFQIMRPELIILKSFLTESVYSLSDTTKSFLLILGMDLLVGFHSPRGWELALEAFLRHLGLPENENFILLFVALFPVFLDTVFKYWIFRYLNKISPSTVVTYHSMIE